MKNSLTVSLPATVIPSLAFIYDTQQQKIIFTNHAPVVFFSAPVDMQLPFPFHTIIQENDKDRVAGEWEKCMSLNDVQQHTFSFTALLGQTPVIYQVQANGLPIEDTASGPLVLFTVNRKPAAADLVSASEEYGGFIDIAAHDLDAPLRKLNVLVERLTNKYQHNDQEIQGYVQRINAAVTGMRSLIDDLTALSKANTEAPVIIECDLEIILGEVLKELKPVINDKKAVINYSSLPVLDGDKEQYRQLLRILLDNALTFVQKDKAPQVMIEGEELTAEEKKEYGFLPGPVYFKLKVADNGIGFPPEQAEKIFRPFVRLQAKSDFKGNGIGLAIANRIIKNHGGIIYAYNAESAGARFIFILPQTIE